MKAIERDGVDNTIIVVPRKSGCKNSTFELNRKIQSLLLPDECRSIQYGKKEFKVGDKVIQRDNNTNKNVFNGEIGYVTKIWEEKKNNTVAYQFEVRFSMGDKEKYITYQKNEMDQLELAYALTIHLTQG